MDKLMMVEKELKESLKKDYPDFHQGDIIKVHYKIREKDKERVQYLEGIVIKVHGQMQRKTFTIRRFSYGEAYEVTFPYYSPNIDKIEMVKESHKIPRRHRLYYLREKIGKEAMMT
ncbi:MAG: 50S ribosomal protein L19 [Candidatus Omnitrophota bacterium]|nr:50S ribosomal protein L19 [Candidatus Omnitrophota bacterium]